MTLINSSKKGELSYSDVMMMFTVASRCNILIATPGRLADLLQRQHFGLSHSVKSLVRLFPSSPPHLCTVGAASIG